MNYIIENTFSFIAILLMITSLGLQLSYIKFKKKSYPAQAEIKEIIKRRFFNVLRIKILSEKQNYEATIFKFKISKKPGDLVDIVFNPYSINEEDQSIVISKIFQKLNSYYFDKPIVYLKGQNPLPFYLALLMAGFVIALFR